MQIRVGDASFRLKNVPFMTNFMLKFTVLRPFLVYDILLLLLLLVEIIVKIMINYNLILYYVFFEFWGADCCAKFFFQDFWYFRNSQNRCYHENRGEISCRTVVARGRGLVSLTIS